MTRRADTADFFSSCAAKCAPEANLLSMGWVGEREDQTVVLPDFDFVSVHELSCETARLFVVLGHKFFGRKAQP